MMKTDQISGTVCTIDVFDRCDEARQAWLQLQEDALCYGFQSFAWISALLETHGHEPHVRPAIVQVTAPSGEPLMLVPLMVRRRHGVRILEFIDFGLADYNAPLIKPDFVRELSGGAFPGLWDRIVTAVGPVDGVFLDKIPSLIGEAANPFLQIRCTPAFMSMHLLIEGKFDQYLQSRSSNFRADTRAKLRRLAKLGSVSFRVARDPTEARRYLEIMLEQKSRRYRATGAVDRTRNPARRRFYETICDRESRDGIAHVSALMVDDVAVATHVGIVFRGRFYMLMLASDYGEFARHSPGRLMLHEMVRWSFEQKLAAFDFTIGDERYKTDWTNASMPLYVHRHSFTIRANLYGTGIFLATGVKDIAQRRAPRLFSALRHARSELQSRMQAWRS